MTQLQSVHQSAGIDDAAAAGVLLDKPEQYEPSSSARRHRSRFGHDHCDAAQIVTDLASPRLAV